MARQPIELTLLRQLATSLVVPVFIVDEHGDLVFSIGTVRHIAVTRVVGELLPRITAVPRSPHLAIVIT